MAQKRTGSRLAASCSLRLGNATRGYLMTLRDETSRAILDGLREEFAGKRPKVIFQECGSGFLLDFTSAEESRIDSASSRCAGRQGH
jgi:hypothetical protein